MKTKPHYALVTNDCPCRLAHKVAIIKRAQGYKANKTIKLLYSVIYVNYKMTAFPKGNVINLQYTAFALVAREIFRDVCTVLLDYTMTDRMRLRR